LSSLLFDAELVNTHSRTSAPFSFCHVVGGGSKEQEQKQEEEEEVNPRV
jgi:hypothetical protein